MRNRPTGWARNKALRASVATLSVRHTIAAAHRRPDLIEKLVLIPVEPSFAEKTASAVIYRAKQCPELVEKFVEAGRDAFSRGACNCLTSMSQRYFAGDDDALPQPKQPALILFATRDLSHDNRHALAKMSNAKGFQKSLAKLMVPETHSDPKGLMKYVPQAGFQEIERTGHHLELESPDQVCRAIEAFVAGR